MRSPNHLNIVNRFTPIKARVSVVETVQPPTNLSASLISTGVRLTWTDSVTSGAQTEIYASVDAGDYTLLATVARGIQTYDDARDPGITMHYKARAVK